MPEQLGLGGVQRRKGGDPFRADGDRAEHRSFNAAMVHGGQEGRHRFVEIGLDIPFFFRRRLVEPHTPEAEVSIYQKNGRPTMIVLGVFITGEALGSKPIQLVPVQCTFFQTSPRMMLPYLYQPHSALGICRSGVLRGSASLDPSLVLIKNQTLNFFTRFSSWTASSANP